MKYSVHREQSIYAKNQYFCTLNHQTLNKIIQPVAANRCLRHPDIHPIMSKHIHCLRALFTGLLLCVGTQLSAQRVSLKTNALYWATASPNVGLEFRFNRHLTLNLEGAANRLKFGADSKINTRIVSFTPEMRYWFSARPQAGHFVGLMGMATTYKALFKDTWHDGDCFGAGLTYGYSFVLSRRWSMETTIGLGLLHIRERKYANGNSAPTPDLPDTPVTPDQPDTPVMPDTPEIASSYASGYEVSKPNNVKWMPAPLKAGVTFVYILK